MSPGAKSESHPPVTDVYPFQDQAPNHVSPSHIEATPIDRAFTGVEGALEKKFGKAPSFVFSVWSPARTGCMRAREGEKMYQRPSSALLAPSFTAEHMNSFRGQAVSSFLFRVSFSGQSCPNVGLKRERVFRSGCGQKPVPKGCCVPLRHLPRTRQKSAHESLSSEFTPLPG